MSRRKSLAYELRGDIGLVRWNVGVKDVYFELK